MELRERTKHVLNSVPLYEGLEGNYSPRQSITLTVVTFGEPLCSLQDMWLLTRGATLLNPLKIKPPIADFLYPPRGFKGVKPHKNLAPFDFLTPKATNAKSGFQNGTTYLSKVRKSQTKLVPFQRKSQNSATKVVLFWEMYLLFVEKLYLSFGKKSKSHTRNLII